MSFQALSSEESYPLPSSARIEWPDFVLGSESYKTKFSEKGGWACPLCGSSEIKQIRRHLSTYHKDDIQDLDSIQEYLTNIALLKRRETHNKSDAKRANKPERKEAKKLSDAKLAGKPERKEALKKADAKRAGKPERKEAQSNLMKKKDAKRAGKPERKEVLKKAKKTYLLTPKGFFAKIQENARYREKLGKTKRQAQHRKYAQTKIDKIRGGDAIMRRIKFTKAILRGPEYVCGSCHRSLFKKSVTGVSERLREKIRLASLEKMKKSKESKRKKGEAQTHENQNFNTGEDGTTTRERTFAKLSETSKHFQEESTTAKAGSSENSVETSKHFQEEATTAEARTSAKSTETAKHIQEENTAPPPKRSKLKRKNNELSFEADAFKAWIHHEVRSVGGLTYLCATCKSSLTKGNTPCQAVANGLQLNHPDRPVLTELESTLIAHNINFQKVNIFFYNFVSWIYYSMNRWCCFPSPGWLLEKAG